MCDDPCHRTGYPRRAMMVAVAAAAAAPIFSRGALAATAPAAALTPDAALARLLDGNSRYAAGTSQARDKGRATEIQPIAAILCCADSPIAAETTFDQAQGDLFVIRLAGNVVTDVATASLEFAVRYLKVPLVVVLGHSGCKTIAAVIQALSNNTVLDGQLPKLVSAIRPSVVIAQATGNADLLGTAVAQNARQGVTQLGYVEPILASAVRGGKLKIVAAVHDLASGKVALV